MKYQPREVAKSIVALLTGLGTWGYTAAADGAITLAEWFGVCGVLAGAVFVFAYPNTPAPGAPPSEQRVDGDRGHVGPAEAVVVLLLIVAIALLVL